MDVPPELVLAAKQGDREALEELISRSYRPAFTLALRLLGDRDDAADATQEAYLRMTRSLRSFREVGAFPTWMFRIVSNVCMTELRKAGKRPMPMEMDQRQDADTVDVEKTAVDTVVRKEVEQCLARLPEAYRTVIVLRDIYDMPADEVAQLLEVTPGAVKVRLHRARKRLRDEIVGAFPDWGTGSGENGKRASA